MIKYKIQDFCLQDKFVDHDKIKSNLIDLINYFLFQLIIHTQKEIL